MQACHLSLFTNKNLKTFDNPSCKCHRRGFKHEQNIQRGHKNICNPSSRNIIWFNPPFSQNVRTNITKLFHCLIDKHFPKSHKLHKIFNRNNLKVSYSCIMNMANIIKSHNQKVLMKTTRPPAKGNATAETKKPLPT